MTILDSTCHNKSVFISLKTSFILDLLLLFNLLELIIYNHLIGAFFFHSLWMAKSCFGHFQAWNLHYYLENTCQKQICLYLTKNNIIIKIIINIIIFYLRSATYFQTFGTNSIWLSNWSIFLLFLVDGKVNNIIFYLRPTTFFNLLALILSDFLIGTFFLASSKYKISMHAITNMSSTH